MTQPYKVCPTCGQPAVPQMPQCRRCGFVYPQQPAAPPASGYGPPLSAASQRELSRAAQRQPHPQRSNRFAFLLIAALVAVGVYLALTGLGRQRDDVTAGAASPGQAPSLFSASAPPGGGSGLFQERASAQETPTIHVFNEETGTLTLVLQNSAGRYEVHATPDRPGELRLPPGDYLIEVSSDVPGIRSSTGDATFRRYKQYDAQFVFGSDDGPLHLGD